MALPMSFLVPGCDITFHFPKRLVRGMQAWLPAHLAILTSQDCPLPAPLLSPLASRRRRRRRSRVRDRYRRFSARIMFRAAVQQEFNRDSPFVPSCCPDSLSAVSLPHAVDRRLANHAEEYKHEGKCPVAPAPKEITLYLS